MLSDGESSSGSAKTAVSLLRYRTDDILAVLDRNTAGSTAEQVFGVGGDIPVISSISEVPDADAIFIGIAPAGGRLPDSWEPLLLEAIGQGVDIVSGLHEFLQQNDVLSKAALKAETKLVDVRKNDANLVATGASFAEQNLRIHTVGHDCSVGKMVVAVEVEKELTRRGHDAKFVATGQTGIMISGEGVPVDSVVADFISGAVEHLTLLNQQHDITVVEGQGSLSHPSFSGVTLGLLHGCAPQGMLLCYEAGRETMKELDHVAVRPLAELKQFYELAASLRYPSRVIGVAINTRRLSPDEALIEVQRVEQELGLPACDVYRHGADKLADAVEQFRSEIIG